MTASRFELTSQRQKVSRLPTEQPQGPASTMLTTAGTFINEKLFTVWQIVRSMYVVCVVFTSILDVRLVDVPAGVTQEEGHTGFFIHLNSFRDAYLNFSREKDSAVSFPCLP